MDKWPPGPEDRTLEYGALVHGGHDCWTLKTPQWVRKEGAQRRPGGELERAELRAGVSPAYI